MTDPRGSHGTLPPPPPPDQVPQFFRWMVQFVRASRGADAPWRARPAPSAGGESMLTLLVAVGTDLAMLLAKAVATAFTGSAALFAETLHSAADFGNQMLLLYGARRARRRPDLRHPFGYGAEVFYWSLLAALGMFTVGGVLAIWEGVQRLLHPTALEFVVVGLVVLGLGLVLDATSLLVGVRQLRREARGRGVSFGRHVGTTTDTAVSTAFFEDGAAVFGDLCALAGLAAHQLLGSPYPDAIAGIVVGLLLAGIGLRLAARNRDLLTNRSESPIVLDRIREVLRAHPDVAAVGQVLTIYVGPHQLLVGAELQPIDAVSGRRQRELLGELRERVVQQVPRALAVYLMPVVEVTPPRELTPWDSDFWLRWDPEQEQA